MEEFIFPQEDGIIIETIIGTELTGIDQTGIGQVIDILATLTCPIDDIKHIPEDISVCVITITLCLIDTFTGTLG